MVKEAEQYAESDKKIRETLDSKNKLEQYIYSVSQSLNDLTTGGGSTTGHQDKLSETDLSSLDTKCKEFKEWFEIHPDEDKDTYESKYKELEQVVFPVFSKAYQSASVPGTSQSEYGGGSSSPTVEEVD
jgi:molecular chaperone DnaK (HSP70)